MDADAAELRVLGCLIEKQRTTPDVYPLTLNSLRLACNQSTNRDPVVDYDEATIRAVEAQTIGEEPYGEPAIVEQLLGSRAAFGRAGNARYFVAASEGVDGCHATLYSDGVVAQIEDVATVLGDDERSLELCRSAGVPAPIVSTQSANSPGR